MKSMKQTTWTIPSLSYYSGFYKNWCMYTSTEWAQMGTCKYGYGTCDSTEPITPQHVRFAFVFTFMIISVHLLQPCTCTVER